MRSVVRQPGRPITRSFGIVAANRGVKVGGPYRLVRHPMYAGIFIFNLGIALWLESYAAALGAVVPVALMIARLRLEERFLRRALPGYADYAARVPYRLGPGVW